MLENDRYLPATHNYQYFRPNVMSEARWLGLLSMRSYSNDSVVHRTRLRRVVENPHERRSILRLVRIHIVSPQYSPVLQIEIRRTLSSKKSSGKFRASANRGNNFRPRFTAAWLRM